MAFGPMQFFDIVQHGGLCPQCDKYYDSYQVLYVMEFFPEQGWLGVAKSTFYIHNACDKACSKAIRSR